nr:hypothetical protein [Tanacetum cinerariifolium]
MKMTMMMMVIMMQVMMKELSLMTFRMMMIKKKSMEMKYDRIDDDLYKHASVKLKDVEHGEEVKGDAEMTDAGHDDRYIDLIEKSVKDIINDEVKTQLPQILPKAESDFATPVIKSTIIESLEDVVLAKSFSQPQSTYEAATSLTEFKLKKILIDKMEKSQSNLTADEHKELYNALVNSYNVDKDFFLVYGTAVSLKRSRKDKDKDEDPPAGSNQWMKR